MCWRAEDERYNNGGPFKLTCRTSAGVVVTLLADNYYGYCKKEVKTQISYAANLLGNAEEEHAGGAIAFASFSLGLDDIADQQRGGERPDVSPTWCATTATAWTCAPKVTRVDKNISRASSTSPKTPARTPPASRCGGKKTASSSRSPCCPAKPT